ncbi:hypothetical protein [Janthinobacterium lividum]|uniref:Uncharacterized protein n=1 Tax=Janthinobacterium lividum TaxID=29581 RepID=A0ABU0Y1E8_9BURK|nr:hypothetical protein [Janthinobacterium lividum]MBR7637086.1 hypothetical protein [Janthinobacterium lividum]MDQ4628959.1 hypothetical protein [Janthinobacterium lividum]MDQ4678050.1 hypothetical protein [Janthinobacterium lividum]
MAIRISVLSASAAHWPAMPDDCVCRAVARCSECYLKTTLFMTYAQLVLIIDKKARSGNADGLPEDADFSIER